MVRKEDIEKLLNNRIGYLLKVAAVGLPPSQFESFRNIVLNEFGKSGIGKDLDRLFGNNTARHGTGRNTLRKEGGAS
jgi:hypothetical protein